MSHYCPTAAAQLSVDHPVITILSNAPGFPDTGEYVGLAADAELPPLLRPDCLLDWSTWWMIEERAVRLVHTHPESALPRLMLAVEELRRWRPGDSELMQAAAKAFDAADEIASDGWRPSTPLTESHLAHVMAAVPSDWRGAAAEALATRRPPLRDDVFGRLLAAHAFANWAAYLGKGLRTWYQSIEAAGCLAALTGDAGVTDLVLRHLADSSALIARWSRSEGDPAIRRP